MAHVSYGHDDALAVLFDPYCRLVFKIALKILRDAGEAEDVMLNVFLEIYSAAAQSDPARRTTKVRVLQYAYHPPATRDCARTHLYHACKCTRPRHYHCYPSLVRPH